MKKLTTLILSAAIIPALALSTAAMAEDHDDMQADTEQQADEQRAGEQQMSGKPAGAFYADDVIGKTVKHRGSDKDVGEIQDLIIGEDGHIVGVVVKTGGFLGLGGQDIGLGWDHIEHTMEDDESVFYTDIDEETLRNSPKYERD
ncbi:hypothetical protein GCM10007160_39850 [Litchfieldella qijiaojingensis]|uniref:PRC-barrel domain-containing protein n=2 Tax=Litchfieldella qijiaojingensis TaxID=980347 RepID=A0ABQ2ZC73_9GAMM|nr:hypothetical protein GCM10007160_39850 [Halomonas qijiaojingensis]